MPAILRGLCNGKVGQFHGISWREGRMLLGTRFMAAVTRLHGLDLGLQADRQQHVSACQLAASRL